jgi:SAM-dependent methyltransferase
LGIGTGYELDLLFERAPGCRVVGLDISEKMLAHCRAKVPDRRRLALKRKSLFDYEYPSHAYDYVIAIATMHHFLQETRGFLYRKILATLKPGGRYIEADKFAPADLEATVISNYRRRMNTLPDGTVPGTYHIDVPLAVATVTNLLRDCGYRNVRLPYDAPERDSAIISATSPDQ